MMEAEKPSMMSSKKHLQIGYISVSLPYTTCPSPRLLFFEHLRHMEFPSQPSWSCNPWSSSMPDSQPIAPSWGSNPLPRVLTVAQRDLWCLGSGMTPIWCLARHSGLRIQHCCSCCLGCNCNLDGSDPCPRISKWLEITKKEHLSPPHPPVPSTPETLQIPFPNLFFFWLHMQHVEVPGPGIKPVLQQWPELLQWQCQILNSLHRNGTPLRFFIL